MKKIILIFTAILMSLICYSQELLRPNSPSTLTLPKKKLHRTFNEIKGDTVKNTWFNIFNSKDTFDASILWGTEKNNSALLQGFFGEQNGAVSTDFFTDNFGKIRVSLAGIVSAGRNDSTKNINSFLAGGGNAVIKGICPLTLWWGKNAVFGLYGRGALFFNIPQLGSQTQNAQLGGQFQLESQYSIIGNNNTLGLSFRGMLGVASGSGLWLNSILKNNSDVFSYGSIGMSIMITESYCINFNKSYGLINAKTFSKQNATIGLTANF